VGPQKPGDVGRLIARDKHANLLLCERRLIYLDIVQEIIMIENITTVGNARKGSPCKPTTSVA
jgi:hypothetical protein